MARKINYPDTDEPRQTGHPPNPIDDIDDFTTMHLIGCTCPECNPDIRHDEAAA